MLTSVRYDSQSGNAAWPIPFPYGRPQDVGVRLVNSEGRETILVLNRDYVIQNNNVICIIPSACALVIYLDTPVDDALAANNARVLAAQAYAAPAAMPASDSASVLQAQALARTEELETKIDRLLLEREASAALLVQQQEQSLQEEQEKILAQAEAKLAAVENASATAQKLVEDKTDLALEAIELRGGEIEDSINIRAGALLAATSLARDAASDARAQALDAQAQVDSAIERLEARVAELEDRLDRRARDGRKALEGAAENGLARISSQVEEGRAAARQVSNDAIAETQRAASLAVQNANEASRATTAAVQSASRAAQEDLSQATRLAGQAWPQTGWKMQEEDAAARAVISLPDPLRYWPDRNSLFITLNGYALTPGRDFEELGQPTTLSNAARFLVPLNRGDILGFWVAPVNSAQAASEEARSNAALAQRYSGDSQAAARLSGQSRDAASSYADRASYFAGEAERISRTVHHWHPLCKEEADRAWQACEDAKHAFYQASMVSMRPGISHVACVDDLLNAREGCYITNPYLGHAPAPFYGVFPVQDMDEIKWDGFFFLGKPYIEPPYTFPDPPCPCAKPALRPEPIVEKGPPASWAPCHHSHCPKI